MEETNPNHALIHANRPKEISSIKKRKYQVKMKDQQGKETLKDFNRPSTDNDKQLKTIKIKTT